MPARSSRRPRLMLDVPALLLERLAWVRLLDGRPVAEWVRATLAAAVGRLILEAPGWAWARPASPWWREEGGGVVRAAPVGALSGGERVLVLALLPECFGEGLDPEGDGLGFLVDVVPAEEEGGRVLRRVVVRAGDVLPWRRRRGEPVPSGSPAADRAERRAREQRERRAATDARGHGGAEPPSTGVAGGGPLV